MLSSVPHGCPEGPPHGGADPGCEAAGHALPAPAPVLAAARRIRNTRKRRATPWPSQADSDDDDKPAASCKRHRQQRMTPEATAATSSWGSATQQAMPERSWTPGHAASGSSQSEQHDNSPMAASVEAHQASPPSRPPRGLRRCQVICARAPPPQMPFSTDTLTRRAWVRLARQMYTVQS